MADRQEITRCRVGTRGSGFGRTVGRRRLSAAVELFRRGGAVGHRVNTTSARRVASSSRAAAAAHAHRVAAIDDVARLAVEAAHAVDAQQVGRLGRRLLDVVVHHLLARSTTLQLDVVHAPTGSSLIVGLADDQTTSGSGR